MHKTKSSVINDLPRRLTIIVRFWCSNWSSWCWLSSSVSVSLLVSLNCSTSLSMAVHSYQSARSSLRGSDNFSLYDNSELWKNFS